MVPLFKILNRDGLWAAAHSSYQGFQGQHPQPYFTAKAHGGGISPVEHPARADGESEGGPSGRGGLQGVPRAAWGTRQSVAAISPTSSVVNEDHSGFAGRRKTRAESRCCLQLPGVKWNLLQVWARASRIRGHKAVFSPSLRHSSDKAGTRTQSSPAEPSHHLMPFTQLSAGYPDPDISLVRFPHPFPLSLTSHPPLAPCHSCHVPLPAPQSPHGLTAPAPSPPLHFLTLSTCPPWSPPHHRRVREWAAGPISAAPGCLRVGWGSACPEAAVRNAALTTTCCLGLALQHAAFLTRLSVKTHLFYFRSLFMSSLHLQLPLTFGSRHPTGSYPKIQHRNHSKSFSRRYEVCPFLALLWAGLAALRVLSARGCGPRAGNVPGPGGAQRRAGSVWCTSPPWVLLAFFYPNKLVILFTQELVFHITVSTSEANRLRAQASSGQAGAEWLLSTAPVTHHTAWGSSALVFRAVAKQTRQRPVTSLHLWV